MIPLKAQYDSAGEQLKALLDPNDYLVSSLANTAALIKSNFPKISWVGFYIADNGILYLGPFQGKLACTQIPFGKGVCGTAAAKKQTLCVPDVHSFEGHIACDSDSNSELVVPVIVDGEVAAVFDIDSTLADAFGDDDVELFESCMKYIASSIWKQSKK